MSINGISAYTNAMTQAATFKAAKTSKNSETAETSAEKTNGFSEEAAIYEPSETAAQASGKILSKDNADQTAEAEAVSTVTSADDETTEAVAEENRASAATDRADLIAQLKSDMEAQKESLLNMVREALGQQAETYEASLSEDDIWKKLANGEVSVSKEARAEAEEAISEDGYWGVNQTSDRILEFAKALAGDDVSKADELLEAFKEGFSQATDSWGKDLPDISQQTYDAVVEKFQQWKDSEESENQI